MAPESQLIPFTRDSETIDIRPVRPAKRLDGAGRPKVPETEDPGHWLTFHADMACWEFREADQCPKLSSRHRYCLDMADHHLARARMIAKAARPTVVMSENERLLLAGHTPRDH